jgi:hypothetical protein
MQQVTLRSTRGGVVIPSLLAYAVDLSKDSQAGKPSSLFGLAFPCLLALTGAQLLRQVAQGLRPHPSRRHYFNKVIA